MILASFYKTIKSLNTMVAQLQEVNLVTILKL